MAAWSNADAVDEKDGASQAVKMERPRSQFQDLKSSLVCALVENVFDFRGGQGATVNTNLINQPGKIPAANAIGEVRATVFRADGHKAVGQHGRNLSCHRCGVSEGLAVEI